MRLSKLSSAIQAAILHCPFHLSQAEERVVPDRRPPEKGLTALRPNDGAVAWLPLTSPPPSLWLLSAPLFFELSDWTIILSHPEELTTATLSETKAPCTSTSIMYLQFIAF